MLRATVARSRATVLSPLLHRTPAISPFSLLLSCPFSRSKYSSAEGRGDDGDDSFSILNRDPESPPKLFIVQPRLRPESLLRSKLSEALNLANSLEEQRDGFYAEDFASKKMPPHLVVQNPPSRSTRADTYFGPGTVDNIKCHLKAMESEGGLDAVFINAILSGIQQRNLEMVWGKPVLDRVGLIIEIFNAHAETKEAKLQSELAALMYKRSRLVRVRGQGGRLTFGTGGEAEVVSARGRGSGGRGFISGAGETELQLQRRRIHERRKRLLSEIEEVRRTRAIQRAARKRHGGTDGKGLATVAVVGYTNAGKSTLVSSLSESDAYSDDRLFATVDPRLRSVILPSGRKVLLSDTVGFISDLPVQLVEAFHATLEEVVEADLLLHVLDASSPDLDEQRATVLEVLRKIGVAEEKIQNMIEVWNKVDLLDKKAGVAETIEHDLCSEGEIDETISDKENRSAVEEEESVFVSEEMECLGESEEKEDETISGEKCLCGYEAEHGFMSDEEKYDMASDMPAGEGREGFQDRQAASLEQQVTDLEMPHDAKAYAKVETSAVMGMGLQELLNVIDKKLCAQESVVTKIFGYFDRKWRPSYTADAEKSAQQ